LTFAHAQFDKLRKLIDIRTSQDATCGRYTIVIPSGQFEITSVFQRGHGSEFEYSNDLLVKTVTCLPKWKNATLPPMLACFPRPIKPPGVKAPTTIAEGRI
jgi:hypothetical protein